MITFMRLFPSSTLFSRSATKMFGFLLGPMLITLTGNKRFSTSMTSLWFLRYFSFLLPLFSFLFSSLRKPPFSSLFFDIFHKGQTLEGEIFVTPNHKNPRDMDIEIDYKFKGTYKEYDAKQKFFLKWSTISSPSPPLHLLYMCVELMLCACDFFDVFIFSHRGGSAASEFLFFRPCFVPLSQLGEKQ